MEGTFVQMDCGCVIIHLPQMDENILLKPCDLGPSDYDRTHCFVLTSRGKEDKTRHGIPDSEHTRLRMLQKDDIKKLATEISTLIYDGYAMRDARLALGIKTS
jgi:hypothetical protein